MLPTGCGPCASNIKNCWGELLFVLCNNNPMKPILLRRKTCHNKKQDSCILTHTQATKQATVTLPARRIQFLDKHNRLLRHARASGGGSLASCQIRPALEAHANCAAFGHKRRADQFSFCRVHRKTEDAKRGKRRRGWRVRSGGDVGDVAKRRAV